MNAFTISAIQWHYTDPSHILVAMVTRATYHRGSRQIKQVCILMMSFLDDCCQGPLLHTMHRCLLPLVKTSRSAKTLSWCPSLSWCVCVCVCVLAFISKCSLALFIVKNSVRFSSYDLGCFVLKNRSFFGASLHLVASSGPRFRAQIGISLGLKLKAPGNVV